MATSLNYPTALEESGAGNVWQNLQNATGAPGGSNATLLADGAAKVVDVTAASLAFAIPAGSSINGIFIEVYSSGTELLTYTLGVTVKKSGVTTETKTLSALAEFSPTTFGSGTDKWSSTWTASDINSNLSIAMQFTLAAGTSASFIFAGVRVTVVYTVNGVRGRQYRERGAR